MKNEKIFYIDYLDSYLDISEFKLPKWIKYLIYKFSRIFGIIRREENILKLPVTKNENVNYVIYKNLQKKLEKKYIKNIVISNILLENIRLKQNLKQKFNILDGSWIYKFLIFDVIKKISLIQNKKISDYEITVLCDKKQDVDIENIKLLATKCKIMNVITRRINEFSVLEKNLQEKGIVLNVSTNLEKTARYSDIIINCDFEKAWIEKCIFKNSVILIQCVDEVLEKYDKKTIMSVKLNINQKYEKIFDELTHFDKTVIYESLIYYKNSFKSVKEILKRDGISIRQFEGFYGKINFRELK